MIHGNDCPACRTGVDVSGIATRNVADCSRNAAVMGCGHRIHVSCATNSLGNIAKCLVCDEPVDMDAIVSLRDRLAIAYRNGVRDLNLAEGSGILRDILTAGLAAISAVVMGLSTHKIGMTIGGPLATLLGIIIGNSSRKLTTEPIVLAVLCEWMAASGAASFDLISPLTQAKINSFVISFGLGIVLKESGSRLLGRASNTYPSLRRVVGGIAASNALVGHCLRYVGKTYQRINEEPAISCAAALLTGAVMYAGIQSGIL